jgi:hypothetical protein
MTLNEAKTFLERNRIPYQTAQYEKEAEYWHHCMPYPHTDNAKNCRVTALVIPAVNGVKDIELQFDILRPVHRRDYQSGNRAAFGIVQIGIFQAVLPVFHFVFVLGGLVGDTPALKQGLGFVQCHGVHLLGTIVAHFPGRIYLFLSNGKPGTPFGVPGRMEYVILRRSPCSRCNFRSSCRNRGNQRT